MRFGGGYVRYIAGKLYEKSPVEYNVINHGISGDRIVDLYARVKRDVWNENPDYLSILIGINDIWHDLSATPNGVDIKRFEKVYRALIEDTLERLPDLKIILCEPFVLKGSATEEKYSQFLQVKDYAKVVKQIAKDYNLYYVPLQKALDEQAEKYGPSVFLADGVHPTEQGSTVIANEWLKLFESICK